MALVDTTWYCNFGDGSTTGHYAVTVRPQNTAVAAGVLRRQFTAPAVGSERVFVCIVAGTTANVTDATWVLTRGAKTTDNTVTWQECTGQASLNGDLTNTATWAQVKAASPAVLGQIIKRSSGASYQICTTAGAMSASEPAFSDTAGVTTTDTTAVWTSLGPVSNFTGGQAPFARLANACASGWFANNNTVYIGNNHDETQAAVITISPAGSGGTLGRILCHDRSNYPPLAANLTTGATITTTGNNAIIFQGGGTQYVYGLVFKVGVGGSSSGSNMTITATNTSNYFDNCSFQLLTTFSSSIIGINTSAAGTVVWNNCTVRFGHVGQTLNIGILDFVWKNSGQILVGGSTVPTALITNDTNGRLSSVLFEGLDLSSVTEIYRPSGNCMGNWTFKDCKINASIVVTTPLIVGTVIQFVRADSGATSYKSMRYMFEGTETTETTITRVGGAVDPGGQAQTRKIVTTANAQWLRPFQAEPYAIWNTVTGATVTVTVCGTVNSASLPLSDEIWIEVEYLGSSATPLGSIVTTTKATVLSTGASVASDSSSWNGGGSGAGWSPFKLVATLSSPQPGMTGYIDVRVRAAKASTTYYIDPKVALT